MILTKQQENDYWKYVGRNIIPSLRVITIVGTLLIFVSGPLPDYLQEGVPSFITNIKYPSIAYCLVIYALSYLYPHLLKKYFQEIYFIAIILVMLPNAIHSGIEGGWNDQHMLNFIQVEAAFTLFLPSSRKWGIITLSVINLLYIVCGFVFNQRNGFDSYFALSFIDQITMFAICVYGHGAIVRYRYKNFSKRLLIEEKNDQLQQKNLRLKINPHFIFNALSTTANFIYNKKNEEAHQHIIKFSNLLRLNLEKSDELHHSLEEEKEFLQSYLDLQSTMLNNFTYSLQIEENIDTEDVQIPAFIIQPYVENALIHAFQNKENNHLAIRVRLSTTEGYLHIEIEDNGIGRNAAEKTKSGNKKSLGMNITEQRIKALHKNNEIHIKIEDLYNNEQLARGTRVTICAPYKQIF